MSAEMTMGQRIEGMKEWATDQMGKHAGPIAIAPGVTIINPDGFIQKQLATMGAYQARSIMHTSAYMHLYQFKRFLETKPNL
jgi:hypothetical protein